MIFNKQTKKIVLILAVVGFGFLGCNQSDPGINVSLGVIHHRASGATLFEENEPRVFTTDLDYQITLEKAYIALASAELSGCHESTRLMRPGMLWEAFVGNAMAHSEGSSTRIGVPIIKNILGADMSLVEWGTFEPAPGNYCHLSLTLEPADSDAMFLPSDIDMVGKTIYLSGSYVPPGGGSGVPFVVTSSELRTQEIHFHDDNDQEVEVTYTVADPMQQLTVGMRYDYWFDQVDFQTMNASGIENQVLTNVALSIHQHP
ncbi:MAG: hypothetical protein KDD48_00925 [Bdellovibrionales bacterium]|nr:hypothetical protein [Bdellovibrionales bacterium]